MRGHPPHVRFAWPAGSADFTIESAGAGSSRVSVQLKCSGPGDLADRVLGSLADRVDDNFTPG
ncbi:hypothetical protein [Amycolatopsis sp. FDAARGOS 1241]|uniref:hypothetical protein n=1 Tax=Amycolatopsis sp. FDAARGOS 1241 TaxID=2778070 RepID=UPI00194E27E1|nr:hypothetical protein [Amycolatopsis sp. FDAARGOS 1241]QRP50082.1 hypothetical protein I6J71_21605 [Amycolatopsis sp. FDAARGOS 1241]